MYAYVQPHQLINQYSTYPLPPDWKGSAILKHMLVRSPELINKETRRGTIATKRKDIGDSGKTEHIRLQNTYMRSKILADDQDRRLKNARQTGRGE